MKCFDPVMKCNHYWRISPLLTHTKENESYDDIVLDQRFSVSGSTVFFRLEITLSI